MQRDGRCVSVQHAAASARVCVGGGDVAVSTQSTLRASARSGGCWVLGCHPPRLGVVASPPPAPRIHPASSCSQQQWGVLVRRPRVPLPLSSCLLPPLLSRPPSSPPSPRHTCPPLWSRPPFRLSLPRLRWCHIPPRSVIIVPRTIHPTSSRS